MFSTSSIVAYSDDTLSLVYAKGQRLDKPPKPEIMIQPVPVLILSVTCLAAFAAAADVDVWRMERQPKTLLRDNLKDSDYSFSFKDGTERTTENYRLQEASPSKFPSLGSVDVRASIGRVTLENQASFPAHSHPRTSETLYLLDGQLETFFRMEAPEDRLVFNNVSTGQALVFPQGLGHGLKCVCKKRACTYLSFYRSGDTASTPALEQVEQQT